MNKKNKHLTYDDRLEIQECLNKAMTFKAIGQRIGKVPTTISKEIKLHLETHKNGYVKVDSVCPKLLKAPFVCNGCELRHRSSCRFLRHLYVAKNAQADYKAKLTDSRTGIPLNKESFYETEKVISQAVIKGQHIYHAIKANNLPVSTATVYRHINKGYYSIGRTNLPRAVKFKPRKSKHPDFVPSKAKQGRTYTDFLSYIDKHKNISYGELDTVIGSKGGNASYEKPHIEKNHTLLRDIVPKGNSFDNFTQDTVNMIFSHINAVKRKQFNGKSAYDLFTFSYSKELADAFGIEYISPENVIQTPALLK